MKMVCFVATTIFRHRCGRYAVATLVDQTGTEESAREFSVLRDFLCGFSTMWLVGGSINVLDTVTLGRRL